MKNVMLTVLCVMGLSTVASAGYQVVYHDYDQVLGVGVEGIALNNACVTATQVKSINPVKVCTNLVPVEVRDDSQDGGLTRTEWVCKSYANQMLVSNRAFMRTVCEQYERPTDASTGGCLKYAQKADFLPTTMKIATVSNMYGEGGGTTVYSTFTFPSCK